MISHRLYLAPQTHKPLLMYQCVWCFVDFTSFWALYILSESTSDKYVHVCSLRVGQTCLTSLGPHSGIDLSKPWLQPWFNRAVGPSHSPASEIITSTDYTVIHECCHCSPFQIKWATIDSGRELASSHGPPPPDRISALAMQGDGDKRS